MAIARRRAPRCLILAYDRRARPVDAPKKREPSRFLPCVSGGGGPCEAWWRGRPSRRPDRCKSPHFPPQAIGNARFAPEFRETSEPPGGDREPGVAAESAAFSPSSRKAGNFRRKPLKMLDSRRSFGSRPEAVASAGSQRAELATAAFSPSRRKARIFRCKPLKTLDSRPSFGGRRSRREAIASARSQRAELATAAFSPSSRKARIFCRKPLKIRDSRPSWTRGRAAAAARLRAAPAT